MIIVKCFTVEYDQAQAAYRVHSRDSPVCPTCGRLLSGYDTRRRHVIDGSGAALWFLLRRLRCAWCGRLHLELPNFMEPFKHYEAELIRAAQGGSFDTCPADDSTIRRWRLEVHPPVLPVPSSAREVCLYHHTGKKEKPS